SRLKRALWIAGDGPEKARLQAMAGPSVRFLGNVAQVALPGLYARAKFFVLPGEEDFGIAAVEAQAAGRPVLALGRGGALETVVENETGVFFPEPTVASLLDGIAAIDRLQADPTRVRAHAARRDVRRLQGHRRRRPAARGGDVLRARGTLLPRRPPPLQHARLPRRGARARLLQGSAAVAAPARVQPALHPRPRRRAAGAA